MLLLHDGFNLRTRCIVPFILDGKSRPSVNRFDVKLMAIARQRVTLEFLDNMMRLRDPVSNADDVLELMYPRRSLIS